MSAGNRKITCIRQTFYAVCSTIEASTLWKRLLARQTHNHIAMYHIKTWSDVTAVETSAHVVKIGCWIPQSITL